MIVVGASLRGRPRRLCFAREGVVTECCPYNAALMFSVLKLMRKYLSLEELINE